ncbi:MAG TPA: TolC family protein, partial [Candidatus Latescibacteria bacterium]|nr:TolC family protein [Candidatus Latescibacterota bacterium]
QRLEMARSARFPAVALQGAWSGRTAATGANRGKWADMGNVLLVAEMPVFDGGRISSRIAEESARRAAIQAQLEGFRQRIRQEVESAFLDRQSAIERVRAVATAVRYAEETLSIERDKYQLGRGTVTDVLDAQEALLNAQANQSRALADYHVAAARLTLAAGNAE